MAPQGTYNLFEKTCINALRVMLSQISKSAEGNRPQIVHFIFFKLWNYIKTSVGWIHPRILCEVVVAKPSYERRGLDF